MKPPKFQQIRITLEDSVATITLNRPDKGNAISSELSESLINAVRWACGTAIVRVIILTGSGKYFCSGMDLASSSELSFKGTAFERALDMFETVKQCPKPTIAALNGPALGGGFGLALCCDLRIASDKVYAQLSEVRRGLVPAIISRYLVEELGASTARAWMLLGNRITAESLLSSGAIHIIVTENSDASWNAAIKLWVDNLVAGGPAAQQDCKALVNSLIRDSTEKALMKVNNTFEGMMTSAQAMYGIQCFLEKKKPNWDIFLNGDNEKREFKL